jgi:hypothetical protein
MAQDVRMTEIADDFFLGVTGYPFRAFVPDSDAPV